MKAQIAAQLHPETTGELVVVEHTEEETGGVLTHVRNGDRRGCYDAPQPSDQEDRAYLHEMFVVVRAGSQMAVKAVHTLSVITF